MKTMVIKVHPTASKNIVIPSTTQEYELEVYTTAPATNNKANQEIIKLLSKHLHLPRSQILLLKGEKNKLKTIGVLDH